MMRKDLKTRRTSEKESAPYLLVLLYVCLVFSPSCSSFSASSVSCSSSSSSTSSSSTSSLSSSSFSSSCSCTTSSCSSFSCSSSSSASSSFYSSSSFSSSSSTSCSPRFSCSSSISASCSSCSSVAQQPSVRDRNAQQSTKRPCDPGNTKKKRAKRNNQKDGANLKERRVCRWGTCGREVF